MSTQIEKLYGRINNGKIVEYPVRPEHIKARGHNPAIYTEAVMMNPPKYDPVTEYLRQDLQYNGAYIIVNHIVAKKTLAMLLRDIYKDGVDKDVFVTDISPELVEAGINQIKVEVDRLLNEFVATRGYDSIVSCVGYATSTDATFKEEAQRATVLRDATYRTLYNHLAEVTSGAAPIPRSFKEVKDLLPELTW